MFFCILLFFTLFFLHFLSLLYWQCMLLHVIFGILHHSFLIVCVPGSLPLPARRQMLSFTICRIFSPEKHKCRCMRQRHLNKERNFFGGESVLCIEEIFLSSSLVYSIPDFPVYANFCRIFFAGNKKSAARRFFKYGNFFLLCSFLCTTGHMPWR